MTLPAKSSETVRDGLSPVAQELLERVHFPELFPAKIGPLAVIETHISVIVLSRSLVFKFKKPVHFDFIDHRELSTRWRAAVEEVLLNRRLSHQVYYGIFPIFGHKQRFSEEQIVENPSELPDGALEVAVVMKRLPDNCRLSSLVQTERVGTEKHIYPLAQNLAAFHCKELLHSGCSGVLTQILQNFRDNISVLRERGKNSLSQSAFHAIELIDHYFEDKIDSLTSLIKARNEKSMFINGHGDLRSEHIYFYDNSIAVIDCIEFSEDLRRVDVLDDIAFLCMDLEYQFRPDLAKALLERYLAESDYPMSSALFSYYKTYRACVRAKVELLSSAAPQDRHIQAAENYLALAARTTIKSPFVLAIGGLMGVGKSTLAKHIAGLTYAPLIQTDNIRRELHTPVNSDKTLEFGTGKYSTEARARVYEEMIEQASHTLSRGNPVILDASFGTQAQRNLVRNLGKKFSIPVYFSLCELSEKETRARLEKRRTDPTAISDGREELLHAQTKAFEDLTSLELLDTIKIDMSAPIHRQAKQVLKKLL